MKVTFLLDQQPRSIWRSSSNLGKISRHGGQQFRPCPAGITFAGAGSPNWSSMTIRLLPDFSILKDVPKGKPRGRLQLSKTKKYRSCKTSNRLSASSFLSFFLRRISVSNGDLIYKYLPFLGVEHGEKKSNFFQFWRRSTSTGQTPSSYRFAQQRNQFQLWWK